MAELVETAAQLLVAGVDYPSSHRQLVECFSDERACAEYLVGLRWPDGYVCDVCGVVDTPWWATASRLICRHCRAQRSLRAGTIFEQTKTVLPVWFAAAWLMTGGKNGVSATTMSRTLGVAYETAWVMLHRFRVAMVRAERPRLSGTVEVDETFVGGVTRGAKAGRGGASQVPVGIAVELLSPRGFGRCRLSVLPDAGRPAMERFVTQVVEPGSRVKTDAWLSYWGLNDLGYVHQPTNLKADPRPAHEVHPGVHRVASLLKRWLSGTHQGAVRAEHLQGYLEEYTFRFNRRHSGSRGLVFRRLLEQAVATGPVTREEVIGGWWPEAGTITEPTPEGVIRTLVASDDDATRRTLLLRLHHDERFIPVAYVPAEVELVAQHVSDLDADLVIIDADHASDTDLVIAAAHEHGATTVVYLADEHSRAADAARAAGAGLVLAKRRGKGLLGACQRLIQARMPTPDRADEQVAGPT
jgi:transposase-like protein